jgi:hypothetical protein
MRQLIFTISAATIASVFAYATSLAAPIAQIPSAVRSDSTTQVYYYHGHYYPYYNHGHYYHRRGWHHGHYGYW